MSPVSKLSNQLRALCAAAVALGISQEADSLLLLLERQLKWPDLREALGPWKTVIAADHEEYLEGAAEHGFDVVPLSMPDSPVYDRLTQALLESVADDFLAPGARVVALYSGFEAGRIDSLSVIRLDEHLGRLTVRDLASWKRVSPWIPSSRRSTCLSRSAARAARASPWGR